MCRRNSSRCSKKDIFEELSSLSGRRVWFGIRFGHLRGGGLRSRRGRLRTTLLVRGRQSSGRVGLSTVQGGLGLLFQRAHLIFQLMAEVAGSPPKFGHRSPNRAGQLGQLPGPKDKQGQEGDEEHFGEADGAHKPSRAS